MGRVLSRSGRRTWRKWRVCDGRQREQIGPRIQLPERPLTNEHFVPSIASPVIKETANTGVFGRDETHSLQLLDQVLALEDALAIYINPPFTFGFSGVRCLG